MPRVAADVVTPIESIIEIFALATFPGLIAAGQWYLCVFPTLAHALILFVIPIVCRWWYNGPKTAAARENLEINERATAQAEIENDAGQATA